MDFAEIGVENFFSEYFRENSDEILRIQPKIGHLLSLKADPDRCRCGMNLVDGALKYPWGVLLKSKIKSGGWSSGFCKN